MYATGIKASDGAQDQWLLDHQERIEGINGNVVHILCILQA
jgi:hypothetical protein